MSTLSSKQIKGNSNDLEKHYNSVKQKLEYLHYLHPLGLESVPLVEKLLHDLVKTTQAFQELKQENDNNKDQIDSLKQIPLALRSENGKLNKENNELHCEIIKLKEELGLKDISVSKSIKDIAAERDEVKFLLKQKDNTIKAIEADYEASKKKLNEVLNKVYSPMPDHTTTHYNNVKIGLPNSEKMLKTISAGKNILGKKKEFELTKGLEPNQSIDINNSTFPKQLIHTMQNSMKVDKEEWANDLKLADERADKFREEIKILQSQNDEKLSKIAFLEKQIQNRDIEIRRVQNSILSCDNIEELKHKYQTDNYKMLVDKLNKQIDFLNEANHKLKESINFHNHRCKEDEVKKLDKEIINLKREKEALERKFEMNEKNNTDKGASYGNNSKLITEINNLNKELNSLKEQVCLKDKDIARLSEDKKTLISGNNSEKQLMLVNQDKLKEEIIKLKQSISEYEEELSTVSKYRDQILTELNLYKGRELISTKVSDNRAEGSEKLLREYTELANENKSNRKKIAELENNIIGIGKSNKEILNECEKLKSQVLNYEKLSNTKDEELFILKTTNDNITKIMTSYENQIKINKAKIANFEEEAVAFEKMCENKNEIIKELEKKSENYFNQIQDANENFITIQAENKNLSQEITEIMSSNKKLKEKLHSYEKEFNNNEYVKEKLNEYENKEKNIKAEYKNLEKENRVLKNELKHLSDKISELNEEIAQLKLSIEQEKEEKTKIKTELENKKEEIILIEEKIISSKNTSDESENLKFKLNEQNDKIKKLKSDIDNLKEEKNLLEFELKKKKIEHTNLSESNEKFQSEINTLKSHNNQLQDQLEKITDDIKSAKYNTNSTSELKLIEAREIISKHKSENENLHYEILQLTEKLNKETKKTSTIDSKITTMTNLLNQADSTRADMFEKLQIELNSNKQLESENLILKEKENILLKDQAELHAEILQLRQGLSAIDSNYDNIHAELDIKTEEIARLNLLVNNIQLQNEDITKRLSVQMNKTNLDNKRLNERETELNQIKHNLNIIQSQAEELHLDNDNKAKIIQDLNYDLKILQEENQSLIEDIKRYSCENEKLALIKSALEKNSEFISQKFRANELDLNDLYSNYKEACSENERLKQNLKIFIDENKQAAIYIRQSEDALTKYKNNIAGHVTEKDTLIKKIDFLEKYNSELTNELNRIKEEIKSVNNDQEFLRRNLSMDKEINFNYESHIVNLNKQAAILENDKKNLNEKISELNNRLDYMNHIKNELEARLANYEEIINEERKALHNIKNNEYILRQEANNLREENKRIIKIINENKDIKELRNKILMENILKNSNQDVSLNNYNNTSQDDNGILKKLISDLNNQIEELSKDLRNVKEENTRLLSERSMRENVMSERIVNMSDSNSVSSDDNN